MESAFQVVASLHLLFPQEVFTGYISSHFFDERLRYIIGIVPVRPTWWFPLFLITVVYSYTGVCLPAYECDLHMLLPRWFPLSSHCIIFGRSLLYLSVAACISLSADTSAQIRYDTHIDNWNVLCALPHFSLSKTSLLLSRDAAAKPSLVYLRFFVC